jgi:hypothetical protein
MTQSKMYGKLTLKEVQHVAHHDPVKMYGKLTLKEVQHAAHP